MKQGGYFLQDGKKVRELLQKYKWILLVLVVGTLLLLIPDERGEEAGATTVPGEESSFNVAEVEKRMEKVLSKIDGAGNLSLILTVRSGAEAIYASDTEFSEDGAGREERSTTVLISGEGGVKEPAVIRRDYPVFQGALVVCDGGDDPAVRLCITKAVSALTGLGSDRITVCK